MSSVETSRSSAVGIRWAGTIVLGLVAIVGVWIAVGSGPDVCGLSYPGEWNCFTGNRHQVGWFATGTIMIGMALLVVASLRALSARFRRNAWLASLVIIIVTTALALLALT